jgi:hypothetical protein
VIASGGFIWQVFGWIIHCNNKINQRFFNNALNLHCTVRHPHSFGCSSSSLAI